VSDGIVGRLLLRLLRISRQTVTMSVKYRR
jgi:hypothetical protein